MLKFTITEKLQGYIYASAMDNNGVGIDLIVYDNSTTDTADIWVQVDTVRGVDLVDNWGLYNELLTWSEDGFFTITEAIKRAEYRLNDILGNL